MEVRLQKDWTDPQGTSYAAGDTVDVDAATLAALEADGVVADPDGNPGPGTDGWVGPTGGGPGTDGWVGPTGGGTT